MRKPMSVCMGVFMHVSACIYYTCACIFPDEILVPCDIHRKSLNLSVISAYIINNVQLIIMIQKDLTVHSFL